MRKGLLAAAVLAVLLALREDDFALLLLTRVLIVILACLGLNVQFGYAGVVNFAGATFFGVGGYTAAVLARSTAVPHLFILLIGLVNATKIIGNLDQNTLLTHLHSGTLGWITMGVFGIAIALFAREGVRAPAVTLARSRLHSR